MTIELAAAIWSIIGLYLAAGFIFALAFVFFFIGGLDPAAKGMALRIRLMLAPGVTLLWPLMLLKTILRKGPPIQ